jgi:hypothetical protein
MRQCSFKTDVSETVFIIRIDVRSEQDPHVFISVSLDNVLFLLARCVAGEGSQLRLSILVLQVQYAIV